MNSKLTLSDIAALMAVRTGRDKRATEQFLREFIAVVTDGLFTDKVVKIKGIGTFKIVPVEQRESVHVNTGERFIIPAHYKYSFLPDKELRDTVNAPFAFFETTEIGNDVDFSDLEELEEEETGTDEESAEEDIVEEEIAVEEIAIESRVEGVLSEAVKELADEPEPVVIEPEDTIEEPVSSLPESFTEEETVKVEEAAEEEREPLAEVPEAEKEPEEEVKAIVVEAPEPVKNIPEMEGNYEPDFRVPFYRKDSFLAALILIGFIGASTLLYIWYSNRSIEIVQAKVMPNLTAPDSVKEISLQIPDTLALDTLPEQEMPSVDEPVTKEKEPAVLPEPSPIKKQPEKKQKPSSKPAEQFIAQVTIAPGDRLTLISLKYYGHKFFWVYIYEANKNVIKDPNNVPIGTVLKIPAPGVYGIDAKNRASISKAASLQTKILQGKE